MALLYEGLTSKKLIECARNLESIRDYILHHGLTYMKVEGGLPSIDYATGMGYLEYAIQSSDELSVLVNQIEADLKSS